MAELTPKQRKTFAKITEALKEFPFGATIQDLYNEARLSITVIKNALEKMDNVEQRGDSWFLKNADSSPVAQKVEPTVEQPVIADDGGNMQETAEIMQESAESMQKDCGNTQALQQSDNTEDYFHPEFAALPDHQSNNDQAIEAAPALEPNEIAEEIAEVSQALVNQKRFILIENCLLSLSRDEIGESPCLAKDCWFDSHGNDIPLESPDGQFLQKAAGGFCSDAIFRGEEYYRRYTLQSQLFHGVFDSPEDAEYRIAELMFIKPDKNHFEIIEV